MRAEVAGFEGVGTLGRVASGRPRPAPRGELAAVGRVLILVVFLRYLLMPAVAFLANATFPLERPQSFSVFREPHAFWDMFARYDSGWYYSIAHDGYRYTEGKPSSLAFFPLYPMMMRAGGLLLGGEQHHYYLAGMIISRIAFLGALIALYYLARLDLDQEGAQRAVLYAAAFPFALFYSRVYAESLFLLLSVLAFWCFRTRRWEVGGLAGALAALTRVNGVLSVVGLSWIALAEWRASPRQAIRAAAGVLVVGLGLGVYSFYAFVLSGSPLGWMDAIRAWQYEPGGAPWMPLVALARQLVRRPYDFLVLEPNGPYDALNGLTAGIVALSIPFVWWRLGAAYGLHMLVNLWLPLSSGQFEGLGRYCAVLFPFFIWLGSHRSQLVRDLILVTSIALYVLCVSMFVKLHPIF
jgi:hypothetical protein